MTCITGSKCTILTRNFMQDENSAQDPICLHSHSYYELIYCLQTVGVSYLVGPQHYFPQKGDLICILPGVSHRPLFSEGMSGSFRRIVFNLNTEFVARLFRQYAVAAPEDVFGSALYAPALKSQQIFNRCLSAASNFPLKTPQSWR